MFKVLYLIFLVTGNFLWSLLTDPTQRPELEVIRQVLWPLSDPVKMASGQHLTLVAGISLQ